MSIHPKTHIGLVHYTVADLDKQVAFYRDTLGFQLLRRDGDTASLGTAERELLRLTAVAGARRARGSTGLYHTAFLVPTRRDLAHLVRSVIDSRTLAHGTANHGTHLAIYLPDPEGNGIELAWDFPREAWPMRDGKMDLADMPREGVDLEALLGELEKDPSPWTGLAADTTVGHVHLHVADLARTEQFYHGVLGFDITMKSDEFGALFVSAGGYHHHIGTNIWRGEGAPPPPDDATGLRYFTVVLPDRELQRVKERVEREGIEPMSTEEGVSLVDPSQIGVMLTVG